MADETITPSIVDSTIAALHIAYERAGSVSEAREGDILAAKREKGRSFYIEDNAVTDLARHSDNLRLSILREVPDSAVDALTVSAHAMTMAERFYSRCENEDEDDLSALLVAMENLTVLWARVAGVQEDVSTCRGAVIELARLRRDART